MSGSGAKKRPNTNVIIGWVVGLIAAGFLLSIDAGWLLIVIGLSGFGLWLQAKKKGREFVPHQVRGHVAGALVLAMVLGAGSYASESDTDPAQTAKTSDVPAAGLLTATPASTPAPTLSPAPTPTTSATAAEQATPTSPAGASDDEGVAPVMVAPVAGTLAVDVLETLAVKGRAPKTGYSRDVFDWRGYDFDRNGCDARNDVLARDLTNVKFRAGTANCTVETGTLLDPYTAKSIAFTRGSATSNDIQIDHVVALSDAWQKGAQNWVNNSTFREFGNDPLNLLAVDGPINQAKGDGDAATWLPPNRGFRCEYVARQVAVKAKYSLWVTQAEKNAISNVLASCPGQKIPTAGAPTPPKATAVPAPAKTTVKPAPVKTTATPQPTKTTTAPVPAKPAGGSTSPGSDGSCPASAPIKGNQGRNGWIYHVKGKSSNYNQTKAEECFATAAAAEAAGYRAPKR